MVGSNTTVNSISESVYLIDEMISGDGMNIEDEQVKNFLSQLYQLTGGELSAEVSMYDIGDALGFDKSEAGSIAEDLIIDGFAELKNLAGAIAITVEGLQALEVEPQDNNPEAGLISMGEKTEVDADTSRALETLLLEIKTAILSVDVKYDAVEEVVFDIKTLEVQLFSPRPKASIVREILSSLAAVLASQKSSDKLVEKIRLMTAR